MRSWITVPRVIFLVATALSVRLLIPKPPLFEGTPYSQAIVDQKGELLRLTLAGDQIYRLPVHLQDLPPALVKATLLYEDRAFYWHPGVNPWTLGKAVLSVVFHGRRFGASTSTMQLARIRYGLNTRSWSGKLRQIILALELETHYSKKEILEGYFTFAPYGGNIEGAEAASLIYYRCPASNLTEDQSLVLSIIPQSPRLRNPDLTPSGTAIAALSTIRRLWHQSQSTSDSSSVVSSMPLSFGTRGELPHEAMHFTEMIQEENPQTGRVTTSLRLDWQRAVEERMNEYLRRSSDRSLNNAAVVLLDYTTMQPLAWVGSGDFWNAERLGQCDGVRMQRSPGSALKPFIYGLALEQGLIHPSTHLLDAPISYTDYDPENFDRSFLGPIPAREALQLSRNVPAVVLLSKLSGKTLYTLLQAFNVRDLGPQSHYGLSLALGAEEVSPLTVASMYAMLANHGVEREVQLSPDAPKSKAAAPIRLLSPEASFLALDMIRTEVRPAGGQVIPLSRPVAWKTGTSHGFRDAWCVGVFDRYVLVVWLGNFDGRSNPALIGRDAAAPLFFTILDSVRAREEPGETAPWMDPTGLNLVKEEICSDTGLLAGPQCTRHFPEWFIPGVSPIASTLKDPTPGTLEKSGGVRIISPKPYPVFCLKGGPATGGDSLSLQAEAGSDVTRLYWFANQSLIGETRPGEKIWWRPDSGSYTLTVLDDLGRTQTRSLRIQNE